MFARPDGDPVAPDWLSRYFRQLNQASGPPIRLHDLRHGAASLALAAGADLKVVQGMLGHSGIVLTAGTYTSVLPQVARKVAEDIACLIIAAGCLVPGRQQGRRPAWRKLRHDVRTLMTAGVSRAHPARQIAAPYRLPAAQTAVAGGQKARPAVRQDPQPAMRPYPGQLAPIPPHQRSRENRQNTRPERVRRLAPEGSSPYTASDIGAAECQVQVSYISRSPLRAGAGRW